MSRAKKRPINENDPFEFMCTICGAGACDFTEGVAIKWDVAKGGACNPCVSSYRSSWKKKTYTSAYLLRKERLLMESNKTDDVTLADILRVRSLLKGSNK